MPFYTIDFESSAREDWAESFTLSDGEDPIDLSGASLEMQVHGPDGLALEISTANGRMVITDATNGEMAFTVPQEVMGALAPGVYEHACVLTQEDQTLELWSGKFVLQ